MTGSESNALKSMDTPPTNSRKSIAYSRNQSELKKFNTKVPIASRPSRHCGSVKKPSQYASGIIAKEQTHDRYNSTERTKRCQSCCERDFRCRNKTKRSPKRNVKTEWQNKWSHEKRDRACICTNQYRRILWIITKGYRDASQGKRGHPPSQIDSSNRQQRIEVQKYC
jgi:hypothetical protein